MEIGLALDPAWRGFQPVVDEVVEQVAVRLRDDLRMQPALWMDKNEAVTYSRLARGTFEKLAARGDIPGHGGKTKVFNRLELDAALSRL